MSENNLEKCPKCNQGSMRPTGNVQKQGIAQEPFGEAPELREYECSSCGYHSDTIDRNSP